MNCFDIPIVLFIFKRTETLKEIINRIAQVNPHKIYIIADGGRNDDENIKCKECREYVEKLITWECEIIKNYSPVNRGVYKNIGEGAKWVFSKESKAIFLEDDNLPEVTFFEYCKELLDKYENNNKVLWICGTNYLGKFENKNSYMFTKHMLPCGWASWSNKFLKYYDGELKTISDKEKLKNFRKSYFIESCESRRLYQGQLYSAKRTAYLIKNKINESSWDFQMNFSVRSNELYGISPMYNQIKNIGIDENSIHGGNKPTKKVLKLCGMPSYELTFPLKHPNKIEVDPKYEKAINKVLNPPWYLNITRIIIILPLKKILRLNKYDSLKSFLERLFQ